MTEPVTLQSLSLAMDGGFIATANISKILERSGDQYRLIGGLTVMLHVHRLHLDLPIRATATPTSACHRRHSGTRSW